MDDDIKKASVCMATGKDLQRKYFPLEVGYTSLSEKSYLEIKAVLSDRKSFILEAKQGR